MVRIFSHYWQIFKRSLYFIALSQIELLFYSCSKFSPLYLYLDAVLSWVVTHILIIVFLPFSGNIMLHDQELWNANRTRNVFAVLWFPCCLMKLSHIPIHCLTVSNISVLLHIASSYNRCIHQIFGNNHTKIIFE